ncbi:hypothetical protein DAI22_08g130600 [Oryza sativa Japonica Group]|nr:hypothetical protein DAI22_08g130600 [Oryza sativa Japonica Group]KAF2919384.1 hypothetical protein DAI22_08g130600 [Oryza sativa Japonica Group]KAF2919386.1 hypothetical protein DAI22_08g130600 [Oryza sativa Japonica Group]
MGATAGLFLLCRWLLAARLINDSPSPTRPSLSCLHQPSDNSTVVAWDEPSY